MGAGAIALATRGVRSQDMDRDLRWLDAGVVAALTVAAYLLRRSEVPHDGLWYDDAWVALGAVRGSVAEIPLTGAAHPGFTLLLWVQHHLLGGDVEHLALLPYVVGIVGPAAIYLGLRRLGYGRTSCLLPAAALVVAAAHVTYSARVKAYPIDTVAVMALAVVLPTLARRRWSRSTAVAWVATAVALGSLSGYLVVASAIAIGILVLHPEGDRVVRVAALAGQGELQGAMVLAGRRYVDLREVEEFMESGYDAHVERSANPIEMASNVFAHLERVVDVHPGVIGPTAALVALVVVAGLVAGTVGGLGRGRALVSRYGLALLGFAAVGGILGQFPFGPRTADIGTALGATGARHSLWLVPVTAVGTANLVELVLRRIGAARGTAMWVVSRAVVVVAAVGIVWWQWQPPPGYPGPGRRQLAEAAERAMDDGAYLVLDRYTSYQFAVVSDRDFTLVATPEEMVGAFPEPDPAESVVLDDLFQADDVARVLADEPDRDLLVLYGLDLPDEMAAPHEAVLHDAGFRPDPQEAIGGLAVTVWRRG
jgi:hypothetical protein